MMQPHPMMMQAGVIAQPGMPMPGMQYLPTNTVFVVAQQPGVPAGAGACVGGQRTQINELSGIRPWKDGVCSCCNDCGVCML